MLRVVYMYVIFCHIKSCKQIYWHIKIAEQQTVIQQYGDWYTGR